jgi:hypothetical protein
MPTHVTLAVLAVALSSTLAAAPSTPAAPTAVPTPSAPTHLAAAGDEATLEVVWKGRTTDLETIERELGEQPAEAVRTWGPFATDREAVLHLSPDGRVLLVTHSDGNQLKKELELIERTAGLVDAILPLPAREEAPDTAPEGDAPEPLYVPRPNDDATVVLVQSSDQEEYALVLDKLVASEPYLESFGLSARRLAGFTLVRPLVATWIESLDGQEEWDVRNELVHRLAHLLVARRFGELPFWLESGIAWHVEEQLMKGIYCFPYRNQFVFATEHSAWTSELASAFRRREAPFFEDLCAWQRGTYRGAQARQSFGFARFLAEHHSDVFGAVLDDLFDLRSRHGVVVHDDGNWELIPGWEAPAADQLAVFQRHLGEDVLSEVATYFEKGSKYKPKKRRD